VRGRERGSVVPLWLKIGYTAWFAAWLPVYWIHHGAANFLWLCDVAVFLTLIALWSESRILVSSQLLATLVVGIGWTLDLAGGIALGVHPIGGTEYMLDAEQHLVVRLFSLFHLFLPPLLLYAATRVGYDGRRGLLLQTLIATLVLLASYLVTDDKRNLNWVLGPFGEPQTLLAPGLYLLVVVVAYPLLLFLPGHALVRLFLGRIRPRQE